MIALIIAFLSAVPVQADSLVPMECIASNRDGVRVVGRGRGRESTFEEALYQCYIHSSELSVRSCRVDACRVPGSSWRRVR